MRFLLATALATLLSTTSAQLSSGGASKCDDYWVIIDNQTQLDHYSTGCPVFPSPIFVNHTFAGPFELPGIVSIGRVSGGYFGPAWPGRVREESTVTSISFPDLKNTTGTYFGGIMAAYLQNLTDVSFPKLENVTGDFLLMRNPKLNKAVLPKLEAVSGGLVINGPFDEIYLPSLKQVGYMEVFSSGDLDCVALGKNLSSLVFTVTKETSLHNLGLTCWTGYLSNSWNSSDPRYNANTPPGTNVPSGPDDVPGGPVDTTNTPPKTNAPSGPNDVPGGPVDTTKTSPPPNAAVSLNVGLVNIILSVVGIAVIINL